MDSEKILDLLIANAFNLYSHAPIKHHDYFRNFKKGHLIMEITTLSKKDYNKNRIGYLKQKINENEYIIETLDGREYHWENPYFIRVQTELCELKHD